LGENRTVQKTWPNAGIAFKVRRWRGGWNRKWEDGEVTKGQPVDAYDLAYRDDEGKIRYRWHLERTRLDHYVKAGFPVLKAKHAGIRASVTSETVYQLLEAEENC
jgi:hypothetical protein